MKVMIAISGSDVAPRFDLTVEAIIVQMENSELIHEPRELVLSEPSGDELCGLAVSEAVDLVVCGGIDEVHYEYLAWKKIRIIDGVIGLYVEALDFLREDRLAAGTILPGGE
ncbi:MAG: NifB/NifX family molybdenum-iron cluster-binding protein [Thermoleophilia bacterium]